jgi:ornithine carbamoyltransferase
MSQKTKEQIQAEMVKAQETKRFRKMVKEVIYPFLIENSTSIENAKMLCSVASVTIEQSFMQDRLTKKVSELEIPEVKDEYKVYRDLIDIVKDESVRDAAELLSRMADTIDSFVKEQNSKTVLKDLPAELLD